MKSWMPKYAGLLPLTDERMEELRKYKILLDDYYSSTVRPEGVTNWYADKKPKIAEEWLRVEELLKSIKTEIYVLEKKSDYSLNDN